MSTTHLPYTGGAVALTDGGLETTLIFDKGFDLPEFASFPLLDSAEGRAALREYYRHYAEVAVEQGLDLVLETPTWRASADWGATLGFDANALASINRRAVALVADIRAEYAQADISIVVSGNIGPRGDGYEPGDQMDVDTATDFHAPQVAALAAAGAEMVTALTMTYVEEAVGVARAAGTVGVPAVISFTVETDGRLPTGETLGRAIELVDAATGGSPVAYGINCAHPDHFYDAVAAGGPWVERIGLVRANASRMSHEELDNAEELDAGDPVELGEQYANLHCVMPGLRVVGGCCGTDHVHVQEMGRSVAQSPART